MPLQFRDHKYIAEGPLGYQQLLKSRLDRLFAIIWAQCLFGVGDGRQTEAMKILMVAAAILALIAMPAHAQVNGKRHQGDEKKTEQPEKKIDEKAYKAALERIPEPKEKYDPWGMARPAEPAKKPKQPP
jgi:hypothetical protein